MPERETIVVELEERLLALILRANRARIYQDLLRGADVRMDKALYPVLSVVAALGPAQVSEIATAVGLNPTTSSRHVASLERLGLVTRSASSEDARAAMIKLTPAGRKAIRRMREARRRLFRNLLADFDRADLRRFNSYLERLIEAFEASAAGEAK